jgi:hypothetical protein
VLQRATVRSSTSFYRRFNLLMVRSPGFGSIHCYLFALFRLAFAMPPSNDLSLQQQITRWIVLQKARRHTTRVLRLLVRTQFQDLFHSPSGVLLTFPSRYLFSIDRNIYLALEGGPPGFRQGFTCPVLLDKRIYGNLIQVRDRRKLFANIRLMRFGVPGYHRLWPRFPTGSAHLINFLPYAGSW